MKTNEVEAELLIEIKNTKNRLELLNPVDDEWFYQSGYADGMAEALWILQGRPEC